MDDLLLEASIVGLDGWVAGTGIEFPRENQHLWELTRAPRLTIAGEERKSVLKIIREGSATRLKIPRAK